MLNFKKLKQMKKIILFSVLIISILISCKKKDTKVFYEYKFVPIDSFALPLKDSVHNLPRDLQFVNTDTAKYLFVYYRYDFITVYNLDTRQIVKKIPLRKYSKIYSFNAVSFDSIFVIYNSSYFDYFSDSLIQLINSDGKILRNYPISYKHYFRTRNNDTDNVNILYLIHTPFHKMPYINGNLFFVIDRLKKRYIGDSLSRATELPPVGYINTKTGKLSFINFPVFYPPEAYYYSANSLFNKIFVSADTNLLFISMQSPNIYEYNFSTKKIQKHRLVSVVFDTIAPLSVKKKVGPFYFAEEKGSFDDVVYDPYRQLYYRTIDLPDKFYKNSCIFVVADKNFNKLGEAILPKDYFTYMLFDKDYILMINKKKTFATEGKIFFTKFKIEKIKKTDIDFLKNFSKKQTDTSTCHISLDSSTANNNIVNFFDNYIHQDTYKVLVVPFLKSCPSCKNYAIWFYSLNKEYFGKNNVYLLLDYGNISAIKAFLSKFNLRLNNKNIIVDTLNKYEDYVTTSFYNPRIVQVCNKKVKFDKTYYPNEMKTIDSALFDDSFCKK